MKITEKKYSQEELNEIENLASVCNITQTSCKILYGRGYDTEQKINKFLNPSKKNFHSPFLLSGVKEAVERIKRARDNGETVVVYGDYDADGICATTLLFNALKIYGITAHTVVPERQNGYGLSECVIEEILENLFPDLLITVDCGISNYQEIEYLKDLGVDVIVTDHHEIPQILPDCITVNCKLKNQEYSFDGLCGAGVAYKLASALIGDKADSFLDLVALATVADSMPLIDENRDLVSEGLKVIKSGNGSKAILQLYELAGAKDVSASSLAYSVAPRVNASGRMGDAYSALRLFTEENAFERKKLASVICEYNSLRQVECEKVYEEIKEKLKTQNVYKNVIVLYGKEWNSGILGIVSARIASEYDLPTILISKNNDYCHGSARSVEGLNIFNAITLASEYLEGFGGHSQASGITVLEENVENFAKKLDEVIENLRVEKGEKEIVVEEFLSEKVCRQTAYELTKFEPFGMCNPKPLFAMNIDKAYASAVKVGSPHLSFSNDVCDFMYFNGAQNLQLLKEETPKTITFELSLSTFNGKEYLKGYVKQVIQRPIFSDRVTFKSLYEHFSLYKKENVKVLKTQSVNDIQCLIDEDLKSSKNTLFVISNKETLKLYKNLEKLEMVESGFYSNAKNTLAYGFSSKIPDGVDRVVYLDNPLIYPKFDGEVIVANATAFDTFIDLDRAKMGKLYKSICAVCQSSYRAFEIYDNLKEEYSLSDVCFALAVFIELGFIVYDKAFKVANSVKKQLEQSIIYASKKQ